MILQITRQRVRDLHDAIGGRDTDISPAELQLIINELAQPEPEPIADLDLWGYESATQTACRNFFDEQQPIGLHGRQP